MEVQAFAAAVAPQPHCEAVYAWQARFSWVSSQEVLGGIEVGEVRYRADWGSLLP